MFSIDSLLEELSIEDIICLCEKKYNMSKNQVDNKIVKFIGDNTNIKENDCEVSKEVIIGLIGALPINREESRLLLHYYGHTLTPFSKRDREITQLINQREN